MATPDADTKRTDKEEACYALVTRRYDEGRKSIRQEVQDYWLNHAFIEGHQWLFWDNNRNQITNLPRSNEGRVQSTINRVGPDSRTIISKLHQRDLDFDVLPTASDDTTLRGAALAESVLADVRVAHDWETIRVRNLWATWKGGTAAICVDWDPNAGSPITAVSALDGDGDPVFEGDTIETPLSLAEIVVEPGARDPERARWWIKSRALPPEEVQATYSLKTKPEADANSGMGAYHYSRIAYEGGNRQEVTPLTLVRTYYERPNSLCPKGRIAVVVGKNVVHDGEWPFPFKDRLNLAFTYETEVDSRWTGATTLTQARSVQVQLNMAHSSIAEHMKKASNARLLVPHSSLDLMDSLTDEPGELVPFVDGMSPPAWLAPPQMPSWWTTYTQELQSQIDDMLGVHDVSRGRAPVNIESGYGLSILAEQDNTPVGKMAKSMAIAWSKVASMVLEIYGSNVTAKRRAVVSAPGQPPETADWSGEDLVGQYRATIPLDAVLPRSRAAQLEVAREMVQMGLISDIETFSVVADLPDRESIIQRMKPDVAKARRENHQMSVGTPCVPATFDDHAVHLQEHNVFRKSERWERLTPEIHDQFQKHMEAHEALAAEAAGEAKAQAMIDPMSATIPRADSRPVIPPAEMPPAAATAPIDTSMLPPEMTDPTVVDQPSPPLEMSEEQALIKQLIEEQNPII